MNSFEEKVIAAINDQKAQLLALQSLAVSLLRAMPPDMREQALQEWDTETESAKTVLLNSNAPEELLRGYDRYVKALNDLRVFPPRS